MKGYNVKEYAPVAQGSEQETLNLCVAGSNPAGSTKPLNNRMKVLLLTLCFAISTMVSADGLVFKHSPSNLRIGEKWVEITVVFKTAQYHLHDCADTTHPHGFYIVERADNRKLMWYCGAPATVNIGDTFNILVETGI